ncbi:hypothetical protein BpHYR1_036671 [Brachionus plicatilis]|uniref:Uncharacterized protein n=1 Tax=Brachionus plicatilis TaxID=10195 RepID=A0A3M7P3V1_BRAPC|nr:hypothetical protein BpHYR1_036671 [Brachionus plicatilis]
MLEQQIVQSDCVLVGFFNVFQFKVSYSNLLNFKSDAEILKEFCMFINILVYSLRIYCKAEKRNFISIEKNKRS